VCYVQNFDVLLCIIVSTISLVCVHSDDIDQAQTPVDPFHDRDSQYAPCDSFYPAPSFNQVPRPTTNHHFHFLLFQLLSQDIDHLLSSRLTNLNLILPFSLSVHPSQKRPWANTSGSQGFSRLIRWGYVHCLWDRFGRKDLVCVHSDGIDSCLLIWVRFDSICRGDTVHTRTGWTIMSGTWNHLRKVWGPTPDTLARIQASCAAQESLEESNVFSPTRHLLLAIKRLWQIDRVHGPPAVTAPAFFPSVSKGDECWWGTQDRNTG
jgi:hypothetical protein